MILARDTYPSSAACFIELNDAVEALTWRRVCFNSHWATPPAGAVVYNLESIPDQVDPARWAAHTVWDSIASNIAKYPPGMNVKHVPVGWHVSMERFERAKVLDIDVVFTGALNDRRAKVLDALRERGLSVVYIGPAVGNHGAARDAVLARAKLALNILFHDKAPFPATRVAHLVANKVPVLSERCPDGWTWLPQSDYGAMVPATLALLARLAGNEADIVEGCYQDFCADPLVLPS